MNRKLSLCYLELGYYRVPSDFTVGGPAGILMKRQNNWELEVMFPKVYSENFTNVYPQIFLENIGYG